MDGLGPGQSLVEHCRDLDERPHASANAASPSRRPEDLGEQFEDGRFAGAVGADDSEGLAGADREGDILHGPELA